jgi:broad specificity phosphatase PhoE
VSWLYLIRHGQAGTRLRYDTLSARGRVQARLLGRYLAEQKVAFRGVISGALERQRETAEEAAAGFREAGREFPAVTVDAGWNELDLDGVYREVAPAIAAENADFRERYAALMRSAEDESHAVHHTWSPCDAAIVGAWIAGRYRTECETWREFLERIRGRAAALPDCGEGEAVAVFTSAVPVAVWVARALGVEESRIMRLAGVMHNTAITALRMEGEEPALFSFNGVPHLREAELRTFR